MKHFFSLDHLRMDSGLCELEQSMLKLSRQGKTFMKSSDHWGIISIKTKILKTLNLWI